MLNKNKTILFVMPRLPFPLCSGRKTSLYHYCRIFSEELGYRLVVAAFLEQDDDPEAKPYFIDRLVILPKASSVKKMINIFKDSVVCKNKPMQVSLYWNPDAMKIVKQLVEEEKPSVVIGDMVRSTEYIKNLNTYRIADLDDRISLRYQRQLETDIENVNPYGAFLNTVPKFIRNIMMFNPVKTSVLKNEISLLKKYELEMGRVCNCTVFVSENEAKQFNSELGEQKAKAVPIGVDVDYFSFQQPKGCDNYIGFLGAMSVAHNENAVRYFINDILPIVLKKVPDAKFLVIGGGSSEDLLSLASDHVEFTGRVDDVRVYLSKCKVFVCPMTFGSGIKTKILEAMAMGLPTVTTSVGAENINAENNKDWIIADGEENFANSIVSLLFDHDKRNKMSLNGSRFINNNFTWNVANVQFQKIFEEL